MTLEENRLCFRGDGVAENIGESVGGLWLNPGHREDLCKVLEQWGGDKYELIGGVDEEGRGWLTMEGMRKLFSSPDRMWVPVQTAVVESLISEWDQYPELGGVVDLLTRIVEEGIEGEGVQEDLVGRLGMVGGMAELWRGIGAVGEELYGCNLRSQERTAKLDVKDEDDLLGKRTSYQDWVGKINDKRAMVDLMQANPNLWSIEERDRSVQELIDLDDDRIDWSEDEEMVLREMRLQKGIEDLRFRFDTFRCVAGEMLRLMESCERFLWDREFLDKLEEVGEELRLVRCVELLASDN